MNRLFRATALLTVALGAALGTDRPQPIGRGTVIEGPGNDLVAVVFIVITHILVAFAAANRIPKRRSS